MKITFKKEYWQEPDIEKWKNRVSKLLQLAATFALLNIAMTVLILEGFAIETHYTRILLNAVPLAVSGIGLLLENKTREHKHENTSNENPPRV